MGDVLQLFDTRQIAILIWLLILFVFSLVRPELRKQLLLLVKTSFTKVILLPFLLLLVYTVPVLYLLHWRGIWYSNIIGDYVFWYFGVGLATMVKVSEVSSTTYFKEFLIDAIKLTVLVEFVANFYTFNIWIEILEIPFLFLLFSTLSKFDEQRPISKKFSRVERMISIFGLIIIATFIYELVLNSSKFFQLNTLWEFVLPIFLTVLFVPFLYLFTVYITYERIFQILNNFIKSPYVEKLGRKVTAKTCG